MHLAGHCRSQIRQNVCSGSALHVRQHGSASEQRLCSPAVFRAGSLPLVCRKWYKITAHPSMWSTVDMTPRDSSVVPWLRQRSQGLRHLTLHVSIECVVPPVPLSSCCMPPADSNKASVPSCCDIRQSLCTTCCGPLQLQRASGQVTSLLAAIGLSMTQLQQLRLTTVYRESLNIAELVRLICPVQCLLEV